MSIEGNGLLICSYGMRAGLLPWIVLGLLAVSLRRRLPPWGTVPFIAMGVTALGVQLSVLVSLAAGRSFLSGGVRDLLCFNGYWVSILGWLVVAVVLALLLRTAFPALLVAVLLAAAGGGLTWIWVVRRQGSLGEAATAGLLMAVLVPAHVRIVLGPFGRPRAEPPSGAPSGG